MNRVRLLTIGTVAVALAVSGGVVAGGWQDAPAQEATPAAAPVSATPAPAQTTESAPASDRAPADPVAITTLTPSAEGETAAAPDEATAEEPLLDQNIDRANEESAEDKAERLAAETPVPRQRRRVAIIEAIDKITAESMRFEVEVGGRPVRFNQSLIFTVRACEVSASNELVEDSIAYVDVTLEPRGTQSTTPRQIFRGWMFASTPALSGLEHPIYDAWIVGCKA